MGKIKYPSKTSYINSKINSHDDDNPRTHHKGYKTGLGPDSSHQNNYVTVIKQTVPNFS